MHEIDPYIIVNKLQTVLPYGRRKSSGGWESMNCPMCKHRGKTPDTKSKAGIIFSGPSFTFRCFRCRAKVHWRPGMYLSKNFKELLEILFMDSKDIHKMTVDAMQIRDTVDFEKITENVWESVSFKKETLPPKSVNVFEELEKNPTQNLIDVANYIASRGEKVAMSSDFYYSNTTDNEMNKRVIIPFYYKDEIVGWSARHIDPDNNTNKYQW